jgi:cell division protein FtsB
MNKKIIIPTILFAIVLIFSFFALSQKKIKTKFQQTKQQRRKTNQQVKSFFSMAMVVRIAP